VERVTNPQQLQKALLNHATETQVDIEAALWYLSDHGLDALAWYKPVHTAGIERWGIYFHAPRIVQFSEWVRIQLGEPDLEPVLKQIAIAVLHHERFHFLTEACATHMEEHTGRSIYTPYQKQIYEPSFPHEECIEEGLANLYMLTRQYDTRGFHHTSNTAFKYVLRQACDISPPAYRGYKRWLEGRPKGPTSPRERLREGCGCLAQVLMTQTTPKGRIADWSPVPWARFDLWCELPSRIKNNLPTYILKK